MSEATLTTSAWLAVDRRQQGKGYGRFLLADALYRAAQSEIPSFAVIVDAKDEGARRFYEREIFPPITDQQMKLFLSRFSMRTLMLSSRKGSCSVSWPVQNGRCESLAVLLIRYAAASLARNSRKGLRESGAMW